MGEARRNRRGAGAGTDHVSRQSDHLLETALRRKSPDRIGAGEQDRGPRAGAEMGVPHRLDPQQRQFQNLMPEHTQARRGAGAISFRPGDEEAQGNQSA